VSDLIAAFRRRRERESGGSSVLTDRPPSDQANLVWAFDPDLVGAAEDLVGPPHTLATPVRTGGPPGFYTFGATDAITFTNALDSTWTGTGWTIYHATNPTAGDLAVANATGVWKGATGGGVSLEFFCEYDTGQPRLVAFDANSSLQFEAYKANGAMSAAKHVTAFVYDHTQAFGSRGFLYVDGALVAQTPTTVGTSTTITAAGDALTVGGVGTGTYVPWTKQSYVYAYKSVHNAGQILANYNWIHTIKGW
jgi:hypothetical protein